MESFDLRILDAHWGHERFSIFDLQSPIPNWAAIENWKLEIGNRLRFPGFALRATPWQAAVRFSLQCNSTNCTSLAKPCDVSGAVSP
jgi:hypothetical protein